MKLNRTNKFKSILSNLKFALEFKREFYLYLYVPQ